MPSSNAMLCAIVVQDIIERPDIAINAIWSTSMSTMSRTVPAFRPPSLRRPQAVGQQSRSWPNIWTNIRGNIAALWHLLMLWTDRCAQRRALRDLADDKPLLDALGLTRTQVMREAAKPFWADHPDHR